MPNTALRLCTGRRVQNDQQDIVLEKTFFAISLTFQTLFDKPDSNSGQGQKDHNVIRTTAKTKSIPIVLTLILVV